MYEMKKNVIQNISSRLDQTEGDSGSWRATIYRVTETLLAIWQALGVWASLEAQTVKNLPAVQEIQL